MIRPPAPESAVRRPSIRSERRPFPDRRGWFVATVVENPARLPIDDHAVEKLGTAGVSGIGDLIRDIAGEKAGAGILVFLFRVRL